MSGIVPKQQNRVLVVVHSSSDEEGTSYKFQAASSHWHVCEVTKTYPAYSTIDLMNNTSGQPKTAATHPTPCKHHTPCSISATGSQCPDTDSGPSLSLQNSVREATGYTHHGGHRPLNTVCRPALGHICCAAKHKCAFHWPYLDGSPHQTGCTVRRRRLARATGCGTEPIGVSGKPTDIEGRWFMNVRMSHMYSLKKKMVI